ncbi:MAG: hypothetical protein R3362_09505, partial [Rhodothermales bacterium]|nr:hypothetical protein [Rhodothermales bacterium]
ADDPTEPAPPPFAREQVWVTALAGPSYLGVEWRALGGFMAEGTFGPVGFGLEGRLRAGADGLYDEDADELYDLLRLVRYARYAPRTIPVYARVGPLNGLTLGYGHLVRSYASTAAWEDRTVGAEAAVRFPFLEVAGFTGDLLLDAPVGGRVTLAPLAFSPSPRLRSARLGATVVSDFSVASDLRPTAFAVDGAFTLLTLGDFALAPFASYARFTEYGSSYGVGAEFGNDDLIGLGRLYASLGFFRNEDAFRPGYFGPFYAVSNPEAQIWDADAFYDDRSDFEPASRLLTDIDSGTSILFSLRAVVFDAFEFAQYIRRDYNDTNTSEAGLRFVFSPERGRNLRFVFEVQRQGLSNFWSFFSDLTDENVLVFHLDYAISGPVRLHLRSRYGYREESGEPDGTERFLVQRRFEPMVGFTYGF